MSRETTEATAAGPTRRGAVAGAARRTVVVVDDRPWLITAALCLLVAGVGLQGPDLPAQEFRTWLFRAHGLLWNDQWYAGHPVAGYSLLTPPLAALFGTVALGAASCVAATVLVTGFVRDALPGRHTIGLLWFAAVVSVNLVVGRVPFSLGFALGVGALRAVQTRRPLVAVLAAAACSLASPLAGLFLLVAALAWAPALGWWPATPLAGAFAGLGAAALLGEGGEFPFPAFTLLPILLVAVVGLVLTPRTYRTVRWGLVLYGALALALFAVPNPVGGNVGRLAAVAAGPFVGLLLIGRPPPRVLALIVVPLLAWQLAPVTTAVAASGDSREKSAAYYAGLLAYLQPSRALVGRLEVPMTRDHWETVMVAPRFPLARGWDRQLDRVYAAPLYSDDLSAGRYHAWLRDNAVAWVALPDVPLDPASTAERRLLDTSQPWLRPVWHDAHWQLWEVTDVEPMVSGPGRLADLDPASFTLDFARPGTIVVRVHASRLLSADRPGVCVTPTQGGWTRVTSPSPGPVRVSARLGGQDEPGCG